MEEQRLRGNMHKPRTHADVNDAAVAAFKKHGPLTADPVRGCAILIRECAEAMNEALSLTVPDAKGRYDMDPDIWSKMKRKHLRAELAQVAATAMTLMDIHGGEQ